MKRFVSVRRNGSLADVPGGWLFSGISGFAAAVLLAAWLRPEIAAALPSLAAAVSIAAAAICFFTALVAPAAGAEPSRKAFFIAGGLLTLGLAPGLHVVHNAIVPVLGITREVALAALAATAIVYIVTFWRPVLAGRTMLLVAAIVALAAAAALDVLVPVKNPVAVFLHAALMLAGVAFWAGFQILAAATAAEDLMTGRVVTVGVSAEPRRALRVGASR